MPGASLHTSVLQPRQAVGCSRIFLGEYYPVKRLKGLYHEGKNCRPPSRGCGYGSGGRGAWRVWETARIN
jgi:hypothetical protein